MRCTIFDIYISTFEKIFAIRSRAYSLFTDTPYLTGYLLTGRRRGAFRRGIAQREKGGNITPHHHTASQSGGEIYPLESRSGSQL